MLYGEQLTNPDIISSGGSDWVECSSYVFLTASAMVILGLIITLVVFQVHAYGFNMSCFKKTKSIAICLTMAFNIILLIDEVRYPQNKFLVTTIIDVLTFIFKYVAVIALAHYFISRSGDLIKKKES